MATLAELNDAAEAEAAEAERLERAGRLREADAAWTRADAWSARWMRLDAKLAADEARRW